MVARVIHILTIVYFSYTIIQITRILKIAYALKTVFARNIREFLMVKYYVTEKSIKNRLINRLIWGTTLYRSCN